MKHLAPIGLWLPMFCLLTLLLLSAFQHANKDFPIPLNDLEVTLWAKQPLLKNPVALTHDREGRLYVTEANRRKSVDLDVRNMKGLEPIPWPALDYSLQSVEERRQLLKEYFNPDNGISHPWFRDYDGNGEKDWQDLTAKTERVNVLQDTDDDGVADHASVFAENFNTEITGTAGGVLWFEDNVYFSVIPDLWMLKDTNDDLVADTREVLFTGHGVHIGQGGHDLHGLTLGPDGRIYWSIGDKGINITSKEGEQFFYPNQGVIMRSEPDGTGFDVFAHGLRNCMELAFDDFGNLFCVDNDGDFKGERERLVYVTEGSDTGWRINWQYNHTDRWAEGQSLPPYNPWMKEQLAVPHFDEQAAYITPTLANYSDGPAGFIRNPGTALSETFSNHFFLTQFPGQLITSFELAPSGASFKMVNEATFQKGFMATGLSFGPEGSLYVADWAGNWEPTEDGGIFKIDVQREERHPLRDSTESLIKQGMQERDVTELLTFLSYPDQRVRLDAQFELVKRGAILDLIFVARDRRQEQLARIHGLWGIGQMLRTGASKEAIPLPALLNDPDHQIRIQACKLITEAPQFFDWYEEDVMLLLKDPEPHVRFHAMMALAKIGSDRSIPAIVDLLHENDNRDPFIRHAAISALAGIGNIEYLNWLSTHESRPVRRSAVVALRRLKHEGVTLFLSDSDPLVAAEAARAIHDDFGIPAAMPALAGQLNQTRHVNNEAFMRRVLNANLRIGGPEQLEQVLTFAGDTEAPAFLRYEALDIAYTWQAPPVLDRVERRFREITPRDSTALTPIIRAQLPDLLSTGEGKINSMVFALVNKYNINIDPRLLQELLSDETRGTQERIEALQLLAPLKKERKDALRTGLTSSNASVRIAALSVAFEYDQKRALSQIKSALSSSTSIPERQHAFRLLGAMDTKASQKAFAPWIEQLTTGTLSADQQLDVYLAASQSTQWQQLLATITEEQKQTFTLYGGDASRGEDLFQNHAAAACIRCHSVGGDGSNVGPNLSGIGKTASREYLLESLLEPGKTLAEGYEGQMSSMPPMGGILDLDEIRDLVEYLSTM